MRNSLRQGCTTAPTLFNLYACVVIERCQERVKDVEGVDMHTMQARPEAVQEEHQRNK